ncbi:hypothetical protein IEQ34_005255 [Dendrobium chrysotoxum]|uniref:Uncharacterized protein n=1 Tax=Dendrobium chrysotoxum TaxID=161865 RepID=A0AAV7HBA7_DENCH|nr:hypothetical protein IEQ34_005255 [Dendrobium chrysotoxum]
MQKFISKYKQMVHYVRPVTYRCYVLTFQTSSDSFDKVIHKDVEDKLKTLNIYQFLKFPPSQKNVPLIYELLKLWDISQQGFIIKVHLLKFTSDDVALLTGLPNKGAEII